MRSKEIIALHLWSPNHDDAVRRSHSNNMTEGIYAGFCSCPGALCPRVESGNTQLRSNDHGDVNHLCPKNAFRSSDWAEKSCSITTYEKRPNAGNPIIYCKLCMWTPSSRACEALGGGIKGGGVVQPVVVFVRVGPMTSGIRTKYLISDLPEVRPAKKLEILKQSIPFHHERCSILRIRHGAYVDGKWSPLILRNHSGRLPLPRGRCLSRQ